MNIFGRLGCWSFGRLGLVVWSFRGLVVWSFRVLVVWSFGGAYQSGGQVFDNEFEKFNQKPVPLIGTPDWSKKMRACRDGQAL